MSAQERKALLSKGQSIPISAHGENSSTSSSSSFGSSYSYSGSDGSDDSYIPDWEPFITYDGQLFYLELNAPVTLKDQMNINSLAAIRSDFARVSTRRSKKGGDSKLSKLISKRPRFSLNRKDDTGVVGSDNAKVTFSESTNGQEKEITIIIDPSLRHKFGRRTSLAESLLGISICSFPDGQRVMVAGFTSTAHLEIKKSIKVGDWLKLLNGQEINFHTIDNFLLSFEEPIAMTITIQRLSVGESIPQPLDMMNKYFNLSMIAENITTLFSPLESQGITDSDFGMIFSLLYLTMDSGNSDNDNQGVLYSFPAKEQNILYTSRGSYLTINSLLSSSMNCNPISTTVVINNKTFFIIYTVFNEDLILISFSSDYISLKEAKLKSREIQKYLEFTNHILPEAFTENNFSHLTDICKILTADLQLKRKQLIYFEETMPESHFVPLPKEAQLRIDDALSEMESMDYREWNDEPLKSHREFFILGSALFFKSFLLATHLASSDLVEVESFLKLHGIPKLLHTQSFKDLVIWKEIYLKSCERGMIKNDKIYGIPQSRWFIAVVGRGHMILVVILESRYSTVQTNQITNSNQIPFMGPSAFYIEEIQDTLEHLKNGGIENLASTWIGCNKRPQCLINRNEDTANNSILSTSLPTKKTEIISILKRRTHSSENVGDLNRNSAPSQISSSGNGGGSSVLTSRTPSEDSHQRYDDDEDSDSDWDGFPDSQKSSSGFDMSEMTETLLKEVSDIIPSKLTAGNENVLFHYVQLEIGEGFLLAPTNVSDNILIDNFRKTCHLIHGVLQNTIRFRQILSQEISKPNSHRSLVAIKEHGILMSITMENGESVDFWAIGRLFPSTGRETYLCHRAEVPQNLVEIAFRLALTSAG